MDVSNLISDSSAFSESSLNIWKFTVHVLSKWSDQASQQASPGTGWAGEVCSGFSHDI